MATGDQFGNLIEGTGINLARVGSGVRISAAIASLASGNGASVTALDSSGSYSIATATSVGTAAASLGMARNTTADTAGNNLTVQAAGATTASTNKAGGDIIIAPGVGTGTAAGGTVHIQSNAAGSTGTTDNALADQFQVNGIYTYQMFGQRVRRNAKTTSYQLLNTDFLVPYTALAAPRTATLPDASTVSGQFFEVFDESGTAATNNLTVAPSGVGADTTINGAATYVINVNNGCARFYSNGTNWFCMGYVLLSNTTPIVASVSGTIGTSLQSARADHAHPASGVNAGVMTPHAYAQGVAAGPTALGQNAALFTYLGVAGAALTTCDVVAYVVTGAVAAITSAEVGIFKGALVGNGAASLTRCGFADVSGTYNANTTSVKTTITLTAVAASDELWLGFSCNAAAVQFQILGGNAPDLTQTGMVQTAAATRLSTAATPLTTSLAGATVVGPWAAVVI